MSGSIARFLVNAIVIGSRVAISAFSQAFQKVAANPEAAKAAAEAAKKATMARGKMAEAEALQVLNFSAPPTKLELAERFNTYFQANDPKKGGSFYLQSKIYRANQALELAAEKPPTSSTASKKSR